MSLFIQTNSLRPNRLEDKKDKEYHLKFAKWSLNSLQDTLHNQFVTKSMINWSFYKGGDGQWIFDEDLAGFLLDESGNVRNRLKIAKNLIRPMVEQYVGNSVRLSYRARAKTTSPFIINRREQELANLNFFTEFKNTDPTLREAIDSNVESGDSFDENERIVDAFFVDKYQKTIDNLLRFVEQDVNIDELKVRITRNLAVTGLGIYKGYEQNQRYVADAVDPTFFFFDRGARKPDLSDAEYMGEWYYMDTPSIFERFQGLKKEEREIIEKYSAANSGSIHNIMSSHMAKVKGGKVPVYEVYWKDVETQEYGYVKDPYGYPYFTRINHPDSDYKDKDLIKPPTDAHKKILGKGNRKKKKILVDTLRYCIFIPKEEVGRNAEDIVLEHGQVPYQETYKLDPSNVQFPYKCYTWVYDKGEILSPIDDVINPQRFLNRVMSVVESHINNMRGSGVVVDKNAVDPRDGEESVTRAINSSKTVYLDTTRTGSVQNSVGVYNPNLSNGTMALFNVMREMQATMQDVTGINESMVGNQGSSDALVGAIQSQIQRGTLIQEPFYWALTSILRQAYQQMAGVAKRIYADSPRDLAIMVGDKGAETITITNELLLEDFRIFIERSADEATEKDQANNLIFTLLQAQLIDANRAAHLFNRSSLDDVADSMREHQAELREASILQSQVAQEQQANEAQAVQTQQLIAEEQAAIASDEEKIERASDRELELAKIRERGEVQKERDAARR